MHKLIRYSTVSLLLLCASTVQSDEVATKIRFVSPDQKFAMRVLYEDAPPEGDDLQSESIKAIDLVSLPSGRTIAKQLLPKDEIGLHFDYLSLVWSADSKWCVFYCGSDKVAYTTVFRQADGRFVAMNKRDKLTVASGTKEGIRDQTVEPVRWSEPGVLVCKQLTVFFNGTEENYEFSVRFGSKPGKFSIISKEEVSSDE